MRRTSKLSFIYFMYHFEVVVEQKLGFGCNALVVDPIKGINIYLCTFLFLRFGTKAKAPIKN